MELQFIADVHLGKLARMLRLLGFDTLYKNSFSEEQIVTLARAEARILLSRKGTSSKLQELTSLIILDKDPQVQIIEVLEHFKLGNSMKPFSRCMICNGFLQEVPKESILSALPNETAKYIHDFWQCDDCKRVYWKGAHYERMRTKLTAIGIHL
jgi:uncharacterized protein with PIN domain